MPLGAGAGVALGTGAAGAGVAPGTGAGGRSDASANSAESTADDLQPPEWANGTRSAAPDRAGSDPAAASDPGAGRSDSPGAVVPVVAGSIVDADAPLPEGHDTEVSHRTAPEAQGRVRRGRKALWVGAIAVLSVGALMFLLFGPLARVTVPNLLGKTPAEANAILSTSNLKLDTGQQGYSEDYPKGQIMGTDPGPDSSVRSGSWVHATVSKGPERYEVPKLKNLTVQEATLALNAAHLTLGEPTQAYDDKVPAGKIVSSSPKAGVSAKPGTPVDVTVSKGPAPVEMPTLAGVDADQATKQLEGLGLVVDRTDKYDETVAKGLVISTDPKAGATAHRGDTVQMVVSKGPPLVVVPNVMRMSETDARRTLEGAGFKVEVHKPAGFEFFGVSHQSPGAGEKAPKGSTVTITVV